MFHQEQEFEPTPREEEILAKCVDYDQFREEITKLEAEIDRLKRMVRQLMLANGIIYKEASR